jgi:raffinose/stachyose/melibiose transport system substrate-binding protein
MIDAGCFNDSPAGTDIDTAVLPGVVNGDFLGVVTVNAHGGTMENLAGEPLNLSLAPIPTSDDADASRLYTLYTAGFGVNANSKHIDLAKKLVEAFTTAEGVNLYADEAGAIPSVPNDAFTAKPFLKESAAIIGENRVASGDWTPGADTLTALTNGVQGVVIGTSTVDDMLAAMQQGYDAYIKEIGVK